MDTPTFDVAILGCGPTGAVLANLLGELGLRVVVLERDPEVHPIPRATHIDEETLRNFQATGLIAELLPHTDEFGDAEFVDEDGTPLLVERIADLASPHGYTGSRFFDQPAFERILRAGLRRYDAGVRLELGVDVLGIDPAPDHVVLVARRTDGEVLHVRADWLVGCDGGRSLTRGTLAASMTSLAPRRHWLIVDTLLRDMSDDAGLPGHFRYRLDRARLSIFARGFGRNRRWEFQLGEHEDTPDDTTVRAWLARDIDPERLQITRIAKYAHNALIASRWRSGRILLAGDAAHMMPPSAGQGMCAGIRDAVNLAWKLHRVITGRAAPDLLDSYERERRPHVEQVLRGSLFIGDRLQADDAFQRWQRRHVLRLLGAVPPLHALARRASLRRPPLRHGCFDPASCLHGHPLPQVRVHHDGRDGLLDDLLGYRFALVIRPECVTRPLREWARAHAVAVVRPGVEFEEHDGALLRFMRRHDLDFALVRPDRQIFGAGRVEALPRVQAAFDARFVAAPLPPAPPRHVLTTDM
ncbi:bifunctional 3-(3-hydroxy-phenyl)propionate/3-hydroxycinnamic acid hydroxylase [Nannocystis sp. SCPEA4]|uniref:bifunctional 3-(3-hydroxy-phenyl)propionate/3-hydroxycinnamic acid hydroxylase n=1 Tax=Nannocystis sp. SCPEA4 TaxID=2996787 RepID=UPI00226F07F7|nr:bifunctional 3-(3-hydroxy-phenyl)propionate/3-hydroxycinnamic acid hydroxylase [Nannocystis sp. SCPEA4]MCY1057361.1 bifunctional 3-(3-hydroxy-phenyl)propionate/3-hydroxycinnamic acid hydroxylase [Nannocystis sp. SCPEA4]